MGEQVPSLVSPDLLRQSCTLSPRKDGAFPWGLLDWLAHWCGKVPKSILMKRTSKGPLEALQIWHLYGLSKGHRTGMAVSEPPVVTCFALLLLLMCTAVIFLFRSTVGIFSFKVKWIPWVPCVDMISKGRAITPNTRPHPKSIQATSINFSWSV
jgi:hypothetical protein